MAKPNYTYEKRQKEIPKKKNQEEKRLKKAVPHDEQPQDESRPATDDDTSRIPIPEIMNARFPYTRSCGPVVDLTVFSFPRTVVPASQQPATCAAQRDALQMGREDSKPGSSASGGDRGFLFANRAWRGRAPANFCRP